MIFLKRILTLFVVIILGLVLVSFLLPRDVKVARSIEIDAPAAEVFAKVNGLKVGADWSPRLVCDPKVNLQYSGPDTGVAAKLEWTSEHSQVCIGKQQIVESIESQNVVTALDFGGQGTALAAFNLVEAGGKIMITWDLETDMGISPIGRHMGLMMDKWVGGDYEVGLSNLKAMIEG